MKTPFSQSGQSTILPPSQLFAFARLLAAILCLLSAHPQATAQSNTVGFVSVGNNIPGFVDNYGSQCESAHQIRLYAIPDAICSAVSPWTITLTDGNSHMDSVGNLTLGSGGELRTTSGDVPTLNLTAMDVGSATLTVTDPCNTSHTFGFNILGCSGGAALVPYLGLFHMIAPNRAVTYTLQIANVGSSASVPTTLEVTGILPSSDCTVASPDMAVGTVGSNQKLSVSLPAIAPGSQMVFTFSMQATASTVIGSSFSIVAATTDYSYTDTRTILVIASIDPNAKYGPTGYGKYHSVPKNTVLPYLITFENDPSALAPAQVVTITDQLDTTKVEPASLEFGPIHFGSKTVVPPAGANPFSVTVPYDVDSNPLTTEDNIYVRINGNVNQDKFSSNYGKVVWMFESLDAPNGNPPDIFIGFLLPNLNQPQGDGGVSFTVMQKQNLSPGTLITNVASIVFDVNAPILTPVWTNRIAIPSTLAIERTGAGQVRVTWTGGTLEQADNATDNNWYDAPVQVSPWAFDPLDPKKIFRVRND